MTFEHTTRASDVRLGDTVKICEHAEAQTVVSRQIATHNGEPCIVIGTSESGCVVWHYLDPDHTVWIP